MSKKKNELMPPIEDWMTGNRLSELAGGGNVTWDKRIRKLGRALEGDIEASTGMSEEEARAVVEQHLVGLRQPTKGRAAMAASSDALRLLPPYPPLAEGWMTASRLCASVGGCNKAWERKIVALGKTLAADIVAHTGMGTEEAYHIVETYFVGMRATASKPAMAVSPEGLAILEANSPVRRKGRS